MFSTFQPEINVPISFSDHVLIWIRSGHGLIEVDFKTYRNFENRLVFLSPQQYIRFVHGQFEVARLDFPAEYVKRSPDYRVLFKHLISLGYIEFSGDRQDLIENLFSSHPLQILDLSSDQWYWQNPFNAQRDEYTIIFDIKEVIDELFRDHLSVGQMIAHVQHQDLLVHRLLKDRLGLSVKHLAQNKLVLEGQKDLAFSDKPVQEVAYDLGFKDPAYFNRFFKRKTRQTPLEFRDRFGADTSDTFIRELLELIRKNHHEQHSTSFYAEQTHMSIKTLSRKVKDRLNVTAGELIRNELLESAKRLLQELPVKEVAFELGFKEASHFSAFFKKYSGQKPSEFLSKKYNV